MVSEPWFEITKRVEVKLRLKRGKEDHERGNRALVIVLERRLLKHPNAFRNSLFDASKLVSTETLLLKHYYRHQGKRLE